MEILAYHTGTVQKTKISQVRPYAIEENTKDLASFSVRGTANSNINPSRMHAQLGEKENPDKKAGISVRLCLIEEQILGGMRWEGVEPSRPGGTWPSTMPVCQFQHQRLSIRIIIRGL